MFAAAVVGGMLNSVAGGGSFVTFPTLLLSGIAPVTANATSAVALWPGSMASAVAYRREIESFGRMAIAFGAASFVGGIAGALLLLRTPHTTFVALVPWLLLVATLFFSAGGRITARLRDRPAGAAHGSLATGALLQLAIAVYGGYFGGGMGILMLAVFSAQGMTNIHAMNGLKNLLATIINGVAVIAFLIAGAVAWGPAVVMVIGAIGGGYGGASVARRLDPILVKRVVLVIAWGMTGYFFWKMYGSP